MSLSPLVASVDAVAGRAPLGSMVQECERPDLHVLRVPMRNTAAVVLCDALTAGDILRQVAGIQRQVAETLMRVAEMIRQVAGIFMQVAGKLMQVAGILKQDVLMYDKICTIA